ncbi:hypothetical protein DID88_004673 [Monilinia fructigena]|uniref:Uncharacterized protein n=1 Tax=Monilinia fructigena TaxID=38457 RepID=A0A395IRR4_9HELO|nr:hypothetical protein DID88_004673 [Monilinia fructigena]
MAELPNQSPYPSSAIEAVATTIDEFIDQLQLIWATNSAKGVTLLPGSRLAREIELHLIRTIGITVAPEEIYHRIGIELNRFVHQVDRIANTALPRYSRSIADSVRDSVELEQRRRVVAYGPPSLRDIERIQRMERTMAVDHKLRVGDVEDHIERLEAIIAGFPAEEENDDFIGIDSGSIGDNDDEMNEMMVLMLRRKRKIQIMQSSISRRAFPSIWDGEKEF